MRVAWTPNQMRSQRRSCQSAVIRSQDIGFSNRLAPWVWRLKLRRVRYCLICSLNIRRVKYYAGSARIYQTADACGSTSLDNIISATNIDIVVVAVPSPNSNLGRYMKHNVAVSTSFNYGRRTSNITLADLYIEMFEQWMCITGETSD